MAEAPGELVERQAVCVCAHMHVCMHVCMRGCGSGGSGGSGVNSREFQDHGHALGLPWCLVPGRGVCGAGHFGQAEVEVLSGLSGREA